MLNFILFPLQIGVDRNDTGKVFVQITLEFLTKQVSSKLTDVENFSFLWRCIFHVIVSSDNSCEIYSPWPIFILFF